MVKRLIIFLISIGLLAGVAGPAFAAESPAVKVGGNADHGNFVVGLNGMSLYTFTKDEPGKSNCSGKCATAWPPLTVAAGASPSRGAGVSGSLGTITRADGTRQVTYNDWPHYYWVKDGKPGEATGQNVGNVWFVVQPSTVSMSSSAELGSFLTGFNGMTLYTFTKDTAGVSNCSGQCVVNWPPLTIRNGESVLSGKGVLGGLGGLGLIKRADGPSQITYNGWPLYYWIRDAKPGDTTGHNVGTVWFVADPDISQTNYQKLLNRQFVNERLIQLLSSISAQLPATLQAEFDAIQNAYLAVIAGNKDMIKWQSGGADRRIVRTAARGAR